MSNFTKFLKNLQNDNKPLSEIQKELQNAQESNFLELKQTNKNKAEDTNTTFEIVDLTQKRRLRKAQAEPSSSSDYFKRFRFTSNSETEQSEAFNSFEATTSLPPILSGWLTITSDYFKNNNSIPALSTVDGSRKYNVDGKERLINDTFKPSAETAKAKLTKLHFYARVNEDYLYFTPNQQEFVNILSIKLTNVAAIKNLYNIEHCFELTGNALKDKGKSKFTFCALSQEEATKWVCLAERLSVKKDFKLCLEKLDLTLSINQPRVVKKKIKQPFMVIPQPQRICNQGWDYLQRGTNWECKCAEGKEQSPIDLPPPSAAIVSPVKPVFDYDVVNGGDAGDGQLKMVNEHEALRIRADSAALVAARGFGRLVTQDGTVYYATEIVFHTPSEHTVKGKQFPLEVQVLHEAKTKGDFGKKVVLSFLFEGKPGVYNKFIDDVEFFNLPNPFEKQRYLRNKLFVPSVLNSSDELQLSIMKPFSFYTYSGSLTQPPCVENVIHFVAAHPIPASVTALDLFKEALRQPDFEDQAGNIITAKEKPLNNSRATQNLNGRVVFYYDAEMFAAPVFSSAMQEDMEFMKRKDGHYEKQLVEVTDYVFVDTQTPSDVTGAVVVPEEEAKSN